MWRSPVTFPLVLKFLRTKRLNLEEFDQCELDKIKDLFQYLQIPMPISLPSLQWDSFQNVMVGLVFSRIVLL